MQLRDRLAILTGATSGIGAAYARALAARGARLLICGRRGEVLEERQRELTRLGSPNAEILVGDLAESGVMETLEARLTAEPCAMLVNNAGFGYDAAVAEADQTSLDAMLTVHARVPLHLCRAVLPGMIARGEGAIINVGSLAGRVPVPKAALYVATKVFLERLSESMAMEAAPHGVVVQALVPGYVRTEFHRAIENYEQKRRNHGLIRWMDADAVVAASLRAAERAAHRLARDGARLPRRREVVVVPGPANRFLAALAPFVPRTLIYRAAASRPRL